MFLVNNQLKNMDWLNAAAFHKNHLLLKNYELATIQLFV